MSTEPVNDPKTEVAKPESNATPGAASAAAEGRAEGAGGAADEALDHGHGDSKLLLRSPYTTTFAHMGEVYIFHDLYGYILKCSPDILDFLNEFKEPQRPDQVCVRYANAFEDTAPEMFVGIFLQHGCLIKPNHDQLQDIKDMIPVQGRWNVFERSTDGTMTFWTAWGENPIAQVHLSAEETSVWDAFDGERSLKVIQFDLGLPMETVLATVKKLAHHTVQAVKLSALNMRFYRKRPQDKPPYLTSTMPYKRFESGDALPPGFDHLFSPEGYYRTEVHDADEQFDHQETTLSHLLRVPHPALGGRTYGEAVVDGLLKKGLVRDGEIKVLEIGAGLGFVAKAVCEALQAAGRKVTYHILELSPTLAAAQKERTAGLPVSITMGDCLKDPFPDAGYDLVLSNEMIGDLLAVRLTHAQTGLDQGEEHDDAKMEEALAKTGEAGAMVMKYKVPIGDAPDPFYLNLGAWQLAERLWDAVAPGGTVLMTEFGEMGRWPRLSTQLDHPELSIHFGQLMLVAKQVGWQADFEFVMDLIELRRDQQGFASTRSYFRALKAMLASRGVELQKVGYTKKMLEDLLGEKARLDHIGDIRFEPIEDRLMGLVPHEFKAVILKRPVVASA
ncbi:MAG: class I SAM-dependent methyltransferase [Myxococcota bacterium]